MDKVWLKSYPKGVSPEISLDEFSSLVDLFDKTCKKFKNKKAFTNFGKSISFLELFSYSENLASFIKNNLNLTKGERISIMMPNIMQYPIATFGILKSGMIVENINPLFTPRELEKQLKNSGSETIIIAENFLGNLEKIVANTSIKNIIVTSVGDFLGLKGYLINFILRNVKKMVPKHNLKNVIRFHEALKLGSKRNLVEQIIDKEDVAFLQYTGGTTGVLKAAMLTHKNILANAAQVKEWLGKNLRFGEDIAICALPLYHIFALTCNSIVFFYFGSNNILITNPRDTNSFVKELKKHKFTFLSGVNTLLNNLMNDPNFINCDFSKLNITIAGGMPVQKQTGERWQKITGCPLVVGYGLSETSPAVSIDPINIKNFTDSIGLPIPSTEISIRDNKNKICKQGQVGEICVKGPQVMKGYWGNKEETEKVFSKDGWFKTGDLGYMESSGYFKIVDRKKDIIIVSGFNVYPNEIEEVVMMNAKIKEAACVASQNDIGEQVPKLFISLNEGQKISKEEVITYCRKYLTGYKIPQQIEIIDEIPKSNVGKILRRELRETLSND